MLGKRAYDGGFLAVCVLIAGACDGSSNPPASGDGGSSPPTVRWMAAVGAKGTFTQTFDSLSWSTRTIAPFDLFAVACVGNLDGWAAGEQGKVAHTTDGGKTWQWQDAHTSETLRAVRFGTTTAGVVAGDSGALGTTSDGGASWRLVAPLTSANLRSVAIAPLADTALVVGDGGAVLRSTDGGETWTSSVVAGAADFHGVASDPGAHLALAVDSAGSVWSSSDSGAHFARETSVSQGLDSVAMSDDGSAAIAAGEHGTVLERWADGSWHTVVTGTGAALHAALIPDRPESMHYVAGEAGTLLFSSDRGATWSSVPTSTTQTFYGLDDL